MQNHEKLLQLFNKRLFGLWADEEIIMDVCEYISGGNLYIVPDIIPKGFSYEKDLKYDLEKFNWDIKYPPSPSMCQLYLHGFVPINHLIFGYNLTSKNKYLNLAAALIDSWLKYESKPKSDFVWYDHSTSDRVLVMIYFVLTVRKNNITAHNQLLNRIEESLMKHGKFLYDDANYSVNNHGTMLNRSLYILSIYLDNNVISKKYEKKALYRLEKELNRNFSDGMVCLENSINYHTFSMNLFINLEESVLKPFGDSLGERMDQSSIERAVDFLIQCSKPDLFLPVIGDSTKKSLKDKKYYYPSPNPYPPLEYLLNSGNTGKKPESLIKVYQEEGYAFFRDSWDLKNWNEITYASFKSGFPLKHHKHADDLSFTLFAKGKDIFIDSGTYTYDNGDYRNFFVSALAHNSVVVDNENYPFLIGNHEDTGIIDSGNTEDFFYVVGKNDMYHGVNITRSFYYLKNGDIVILDDVQSLDTHDYSQYYHLDSKIYSEDIEVKIQDNSAHVKILDKDVDVNIFQFKPCEVEVINGDREVPRPGIVSYEMNHLTETRSLKFSTKSENAKFVTLITVDDSNKQHIQDAYVDSNSEIESEEELIISLPENIIKIPLKSHAREMAQYLRVQKNLNRYTFSITSTESNEVFAWYILKNGERIDTVWYNPSPTLNYTFKEPGNYQINYFIKRDEDKKMFIFPKIITVTENDIHPPQKESRNNPMKSELNDEKTIQKMKEQDISPGKSLKSSEAGKQGKIFKLISNIQSSIRQKKE